MEILIVHYSEIGLKGNNRGFFEKRLLDNIKRLLVNKIGRIYKTSSSIICEIKSDDDIPEMISILGRVPGIAYFSFGLQCRLELEDIKKKSIEVLEGLEFSTFRISTKRPNKNFPLTSQDFDRVIGELIVKKLEKKVSLKNYDVELNIEILHSLACVYPRKFQGVGGLPVSSSGKVICSLSGGIDSPVAGFLMMKRGCKVVFVHIYNNTITKQGVLDKINKIVRHFAKIQINSKLYIVPFQDIQKEIIMNTPSKYRMIIYRRFMMKICNKIAMLEHASAIVTGDSIGQVASQTLENINCIYNASELPVFAPLIGTNKEETVDLAKKIGTYDFSIMQYPDCCSFMIAKHPETKSKFEDIIKIESNIKNHQSLIDEVIKNTKVANFNFTE